MCWCALLFHFVFLELSLCYLSQMLGINRYNHTNTTVRPQDFEHGGTATNQFNSQLLLDSSASDSGNQSSSSSSSSESGIEEFVKHKMETSRDLFISGLQVDPNHGPLYHAYGNFEQVGLVIIWLPQFDVNYWWISLILLLLYLYLFLFYSETGEFKRRSQHIKNGN